MDVGLVCTGCGGTSVETNPAHPSVDDRYPLGHCFVCTPWPKATENPMRPGETIQEPRKLIALIRADLRSRGVSTSGEGRRGAPAGEETHDALAREDGTGRDRAGAGSDLVAPATGMRVLIACEFSGVVRDAFIERGHDAISCDLLPSERPGPHEQRDVRDVLAGNQPWDLMIAFPPCTHLAVSGARWFAEKRAEQEEALEFVRHLLVARIPRIALENPVSVISSRIRKPDQIIQPRQFGHGETKATCLWLKGLPKLQPTQIVEGREARVHRMSPGANRWAERSRTLPGIAAAMAEQWGADRVMEGSMDVTEQLAWA